MERHTSKFKYEIFKTAAKAEYYYSSRGFEYTPPGWVKLENVWYPLGYRVVTKELESLGLRDNTTIYRYPIRHWVMESPDQLIPGKEDNGGIWSAIDLGSARKIQSYCLNRNENPFETRIFYAAIYNPIYANSYRVKSQALMNLEEIKS